MGTERKRDLQALGLWVIMMVGIYFSHGFPNIGWLLGSAWASLIISGILAMIWGSIIKSQQSDEISEQDQQRFDGKMALVRGKKLIKDRRDEEALLELDTAIENGVKEESHSLRGLCLQALEYHDEAIKDFDIAITLEPNDCNLYFCRAISKRGIGDLDGSIADFKKSISMSKEESSLNTEYKDEAKKLGNPEGHTSLYEAQLLWTMNEIEMGEAQRQRSMQRNKKRRNTT